jgi:hypothetical protein
MVFVDNTFRRGGWGWGDSRPINQVRRRGGGYNLTYRPGIYRREGGGEGDEL